MTEPIAVEFAGDCWNNPEQFQEQLTQHPVGIPLQLDMRSEGPSLGTLGITDVINTWLRGRQLAPHTVQLLRWSNPVEFVPYQRVQCSKLSHFFFMARDYWQRRNPSLESQLGYQVPFGIFIGRLTLSRAAIFYQLMTSLNHSVLASRMQHVQPFPWSLNRESVVDIDEISDWLPLHQQYHMFDWYNHNHVGSIDNKTIRDQFSSKTAYIDTNSSLLKHYNKFAVEIVCETYTRGNTFFPTEKTIRPLMAAKPIMVYASQYYLARLRSLGFQTYHSIWDESYDLYEGPARWELMRKSMNTLTECGRDDQCEILTKAHKIAMHNRRRLYEICNNKVDLFKHDYTNI